VTLVSVRVMLISGGDGDGDGDGGCGGRNCEWR
jgi:hypothetical protein